MYLNVRWLCDKARDHGLRQARHMADHVLVCDSGAITAAFEDKDRLSEERLADLLDASG